MSRLRVAAIVEGHGEVSSLPILLDRLWRELLHGDYIDIVRPPIRQPKGRLVTNKDESLTRAVTLAARKLSAHGGTDDPELILIDADDDLPCILGPQLLKTAQQARSDSIISCVIANVEYETWFVACASSLSEFLDLGLESQEPMNPESARMGKGWIEKRFRGVKYSETIDQPKLTARMDLQLCRDRAPSFDKLCRELEAVVKTP